MTEIVGIRFRGTGKTYFFDPCGLKYESGAQVVVETASGAELGEVVEPNRFVEEQKIIPPFRKVLRSANADDLADAERRRADEHAAKLFCQERADARGLDMRIISAERSLDGGKLVFSFVSEERVDFRDLVRDLVSQFHTRVELRQVGVRDKAKMLGGLGICGRPFCCSQFLRDFHPVSIKMAKDQSLSLSPTKISGSCGRLMCCLKYEQEAYSELLKTTPKMGSLVRTVDGEGTVTAINLLRRQVRVHLEQDTEFSAKYYHIDDIELLRSGKARLKPGQTAQKPADDGDSQSEERSRPRPQRRLRSSLDEFTTASENGEQLPFDNAEPMPGASEQRGSRGGRGGRGSGRSNDRGDRKNGATGGDSAPRASGHLTTQEFGVASDDGYNDSAAEHRASGAPRADRASYPASDDDRTGFERPQKAASGDSSDGGSSETKRRPRRRGGRGRGGKPKNPNGGANNSSSPAAE